MTYEELAVETRTAPIDFVVTELQVSNTFADIALNAEGEKRARNILTARKGYETALRFLAEAMMTDSEKTQIEGGLRSLHLKLEHLGERHLQPIPAFLEE